MTTTNDTRPRLRLMSDQLEDRYTEVVNAISCVLMDGTRSRLSGTEMNAVTTILGEMYRYLKHLENTHRPQLSSACDMRTCPYNAIIALTTPAWPANPTFGEHTTDIYTGDDYVFTGKRWERMRRV